MPVPRNRAPAAHYRAITVQPRSAERMAARLMQLGYEHRFTRFLGYEHFSQAVVDEWADGAAYLSQHEVDPNPREVTYAVVPVLTWALNHVDPPAGAEFDFRPDGAYWIDEVVARDVEVVDEATGRPADGAKALVQAVSEAIPAPRRTCAAACATSPCQTAEGGPERHASERHRAARARGPTHVVGWA